jgi:inner membrane protease subunit 2
MGIFFREHILQARWVTGPSMTPYFNEDYANTHTERDVVLVEMWPSGFSWPWSSGGKGKRRIERGMVVMFRYVHSLLYILVRVEIWVFRAFC